MLINCPECKSVYDIEESLIPDKGKKLRCAKCGNVWLALPENALENPMRGESLIVEEPAIIAEVINEPEAPSTVEEVIEQKPIDDDDLKADIEASLPVSTIAPTELVEHVNESAEVEDIFDRLAVQTKEIFKESVEEPALKKASSVAAQTLGLHSKSNRLLFGLIAIIMLILTAFYARFEVVRTVPFMGKVYAMFGINAVIPGYGLEFQNVVRNEYEEDYVSKLEIRGYIVNTTEGNVEIPTIHVEMMDKDTNLIQSVDNPPPAKFVAPNGRVGFYVIITKPSMLTKYVLLTFI